MDCRSDKHQQQQSAHQPPIYEFRIRKTSCDKRERNYDRLIFHEFITFCFTDSVLNYHCSIYTIYKEDTLQQNFTSGNEKTYTRALTRILSITATTFFLRRNRFDLGDSRLGNF